MRKKEKPGGAYAALLILTALFLASLAWTSLRGERLAAREDGYGVFVERTASAEAIAIPKAEPVNVNTASTEELQALPGIGPALARSIADYRDEHGPFRSADELLEVEGIGGAKLDKIRDGITLGEEEP